MICFFLFTTDILVELPRYNYEQAVLFTETAKMSKMKKEVAKMKKQGHICDVFTRGIVGKRIPFVCVYSIGVLYLSSCACAVTILL